METDDIGHMIEYLWHKGPDFDKDGTAVPLIFRIATVEDIKEITVNHRTRYASRSVRIGPLYRASTAHYVGVQRRMHVLAFWGCRMDVVGRAGDCGYRMSSAMARAEAAAEEAGGKGSVRNGSDATRGRKMRRCWTLTCEPSSSTAVADLSSHNVPSRFVQRTVRQLCSLTH